MMQKVFIETNEKLENVQKALAGHGITIKKTEPDDGCIIFWDHLFVASVPDSRGAEEEVTNALNDAGLDGFVYTDGGE